VKHHADFLIVAAHAARNDDALTELGVKDPHAGADRTLAQVNLHLRGRAYTRRATHAARRPADVRHAGEGSVRRHEKLRRDVVDEARAHVDRTLAPDGAAEAVHKVQVLAGTRHADVHKAALLRHLLGVWVFNRALVRQYTLLQPDE